MHLTLKTFFTFAEEYIHCVKSGPVRISSGTYSVPIRENADQNNSEYEHFSHSDSCKELNKINVLCIRK